MSTRKQNWLVESNSFVIRGPSSNEKGTRGASAAPFSPLELPIKGYRKLSDTENSTSKCGSSPGEPWLLGDSGDAQLSRRRANSSD